MATLLQAEIHSSEQRHSGRHELVVGMASGAVALVYLDPEGGRTGLQLRSSCNHGAVTALSTGIDFTQVRGRC